MRPVRLVLLFVILAGCTPPFVPVEKTPVQSLEIAGLKDRSEYWRDYQCRFRMRVETKSSKFSLRAIVSVKGQNFVRFETFTPLGQTAALYISNERGPALLIPSQKALFTAKRPESLVREFLGVSLPVGLFRYVLSACIPPERLDTIEIRSEAGVWRLVSRSSEGLFEWRITARPFALQGLLVRSPEFAGRVSYDPPVALNPASVPGKIRISSSDWYMEIDPDELRPAPQLQLSAFYMPDLPDIRKVDLDSIK